jgi:hypothetical protein
MRTSRTVLVVGPEHALRLDREACRSAGRDVELLILPEGRHRWLYEDPVYWGRIAGFLARHLVGALEPEQAAARAVETQAVRPVDTDGPLGALEPADGERIGPSGGTPTAAGLGGMA